MAGTNPKMLYTGNQRNQEYAKKIAKKVGYDHILMTSVSVPSQLEVLSGVDGIVFVGPQTSQNNEAVFNDYRAYFSFLRRTGG